MTNLSTLSRLPKSIISGRYDASGRPTTYLDTNKRTSQQRSKRTPKTQGQWIGEREDTKARMIALLSEVRGLESQRVRERMERCASRLVVKVCTEGHPNAYRPAYSCNHRLCPWCARKRSREIKDKYLPALKGFSQTRPDLVPCMLTLTLAHRKGESLRDAKKRLQGAFTKLQRRDYWRDRFAGGGIATFEFTVSPTDGCWHMHLHALVFVTPEAREGRTGWLMDYDALRAEWLAVTGESWVLKLDRVTDLFAGVREVVKYITKPADTFEWTAGHMAQLLDLRGERMITTFGEFRKFAREFEPDADGVPESEGAPDADFMADAGCTCKRVGCGASVYDALMTPHQLVRAYTRVDHSPPEPILSVYPRLIAKRE